MNPKILDWIEGASMNSCFFKYIFRCIDRFLVYSEISTCVCMHGLV